MYVTIHIRNTKPINDNERLENARRKFGDKLDAGGADKAGKKYLTTLYLEKLLGK